jgi:2OG-Fe(II) oxygenase superfamily
MTTATLEQIGELLSEVGARDAFTARRTAAADDLDLEVKDVGRLRFPISRAAAQRLCRVAQPARYGQGEETLLDSRVRDTWEIPKSRVKIDKRRWDRTLLPVLDGLRGDLGLPDGSKLKAELHSMLVYSPGQFFLPHQDSEKADDMIGTLVVTLPSRFTGGAMMVEHQGEKVTYRATKQRLSFVAFYADCRHEVRPVKNGYRIVLTYNLMLAGDRTAASPAVTPPETVDALAQLLHEHFETPLPPSRWQQGAPPRDPPSRLVYLLDHQYTERGLGWNRLKGNDTARAAALREAAERLGCELVLALAEVHESWSAMEDGWDDPWSWRHRRWERDEDDEWYEEDDDPPPADDPDRYSLEELLDWSITLSRWVAPSGKEGEPISTSVAGEEVCSTTPSSDLEPYASEYEGYTGNAGNTMDRWYRRAAVVVWPRDRAFAVRAEAKPAWALDELIRCIRTGDVDEARKMTESLLPFWKAVATPEKTRGFFVKALRVAEGLEAPEMATSLLQPFRIEALAPAGAPAFSTLVLRYGEDWTRSLLAGWSDPRRGWTKFEGPEELTWLALLPRLCEKLRAVKKAPGTPAARLLLEDRWRWLRRETESGRAIEAPSRRDRALASLAKPILGFLESTAIIEAGDLRDVALTFFCVTENEPLLSCFVQVLRAAAAKKPTPADQAAMGFDVLRQFCLDLIETRLDQPARQEDDWSIALAAGCGCELCVTLGEFLSDPDEQRLDWPLAKERRRHVHGRIDDHELPVRHQTRRSGRPYTLVLEKTKALFEREAAERRSWQADLKWLRGLAGRRRKSEAR